MTKKIIIVEFPTGMADSCTSINKKFAYFYNLPIIDVQDEIFKKIGTREITWSKISIDNLYPNDNGHELNFSLDRNKNYLKTVEENKMILKNI